jgi:cell division septation protein DedD
LYLLTLMAGTAVVTFALGAAVAMWLAITPPTGAASAPTVTSLLKPSPAGAGSPANVVPAPSPPVALEPVLAKAAAAAAGSAVLTAASPAPAPATPAPPAATPVASEARGSEASAPAPASPAAVQAGDFSLQFGAFLDAAKAKALIGQLAARGYSPASVDAADGYGQMWHYVRFGGFADERAAALVASDLQQRTGIGAAIVRVSTANAER